VSYLILKVIDVTIGLRVNEKRSGKGSTYRCNGEHVE